MGCSLLQRVASTTRCRFTSDRSKRRSSWGRHAGSTVCSVDANGDGKKDVLLGDVSFSNINLLTNTGSNTKAFYSAQDNNFPPNTLPINLVLFPAVFLVDVNHDGLKDLIAAPNQTNSENYYSAWYYQNSGTPTVPAFDFVKKDFLVEKMPDLGSYSAPTFADIDADGDQDLLVGSYGLYQSSGIYNAQVHLFKNIGTSATPVFQLTDTNFGGLLGSGLRAFHPTLGDLDADGDLDMLVGEENGTLAYVLNNGTAANYSFGSPQPNWNGIDVGLYSAPQLADLDADGDLDLFIGERTANLNFYKNIGTLAAANFAYVTDTFGRVDVRTPNYPSNYSAPYFYKRAGNWELVVGTQSGELWKYNNTSTVAGATFNLLSNNFGQIREGLRSQPAVADLNADGFMDFVIGNARGGFSFFTEGGSLVTATNNNLMAETAKFDFSISRRLFNENYKNIN